ncbi:MAG: HAD family phosphatase [Paracoccaceae bacterium]|nr:HAD family phosphatase [Paracoccaceae bacterium]
MTSGGKTLVWDIGSVLLDWSPDYLYGQLIPDEAARQAFYSRLPLDEMNFDGDRGKLEPTVARLAENHPEDAMLILPWWTAWDRMCGGLIDEMVSLRNTLRSAGTPCWALTNFAADSWDRGVDLYPELGAFDGLVVSGREGTVKPEPRIYEIMEQRTGKTGADLFVIDDRDYNIQIAQDRGWGGHVFDGDIPALKAALVEAGFPI